MKATTLRPSRSGFTLMELLVVIALISILAGMVIAAMPGILQNIKRKQILNFMAELGAGLDDYKIDNGIYPLNPESGAGGASDEVAVNGAVVLYKFLSGDYDMDEQVDDETKVYVERLDYWSNKERNGKKAPTERSLPFQGGFAVIDPMGDPMRYLAFPPGMPADEKPTRNPTYDLWSIAGAEPDSGDFSDESTWITNWGN